MQKKILITGTNGLLGQKLVEICLKRGTPFLATSLGKNRNPDCPDSNYAELDITSAADVAKVFFNFKPEVVIHTAAMTNVDACELNPELCEQINVQATSLLFNEAKKHQAHFQLLSTDFVFDGIKGNYVEEDEVGPLSVYGRSKVDAENILINDAYSDSSIARTIIVYGTGHNLSRTNIVLWAIESLKEGKAMNVIDDQFRSPTWASDLAWGCLEIVNRNKTGIFHLSGPETFSIYDFVKEIARCLNLPTDQVTVTSTAVLNQPAKRPPITGFNLQKAITELDYRPQKIEETLPVLLKSLIS